MAVRCFAQAVSIDPTDAKSYYLQARAYAEMGQWTSADASIAQAVGLDPDEKDFRQLAAEIGARGPLTDP